MKPVPPHHLLSAYLDGELSASERDDVERLLERSPEARQELLELEQIGMLLRQLPPESVPKTFTSQVLDACLSDTGVFESPTPPPATERPQPAHPPIRTSPKLSRPRKKGWLGLTSVALAASALGLVVFFALPKPQPTQYDAVAKSDAVNSTKDSSGSPKNLEDMLDRQLAGDAGPERAKNDVRLERRQATAGKQMVQEAQVQSSADALSAPGVNRSVAAFSIMDLNELPAGRVVETMDSEGAEVAVVKLVVENREQGLRQLRQLLQKHQISHPPDAAPEKDKLQADVPDRKSQEELLAVYVETSEDRLAYVMADLQNETAFQNLELEPLREENPFDPDSQTPNAKPKPNAEAESGNRRLRMGGFGGGFPGARAFRGPQAMKAEAAPKAATEPTAPKKSEVGQSEAKSDRPDAKPADANNTGLAPETPSVQRELLLSPDDFKSLRKKFAEPDGKGQNEARQKRGTAEQAAPRMGVHVLFVLVEKAANEASPDVPAANAPASQD